MARAMIKAKDLPLKFWAEAVHTAAYTQNRTTTRALENKTPLEAWSSETKGYRVYVLEENKIDISRDVILEEESKWNWSNKEVIRNTSQRR